MGHVRTVEQLFGKQVVVLRQRLAISQEELASRVGIHRTYVSQIERGLKSPTLIVILRQARALEHRAAKMIAAVEAGQFRGDIRKGTRLTT